MGLTSLSSEKTNAELVCWGQIPVHSKEKVELCEL
jgi:hypothetical protein